MNRDLFLAILAMDSYNRGYGQGIKGLLETGQLGKATLLAATSEQKNGWETAGFYAIAYDVSQVAGLSGTVVKYINEYGRVVQHSFESVLVHEIGHAFGPSRLWCGHTPVGGGKAWRSGDNPPNQDLW